MKLKNIFISFSLILPLLTFAFIALQPLPINSLIAINSLNQPIALNFSLIAFLLFLYSAPYTNSIEMVGSILYFITNTLIIFSKNILMMICMWELAAIAALLIIASHCKNLSPILRYATIHFFGGTLILTAVPYELMLCDINVVKQFLNNIQLVLLSIGILINCAIFPLSTWVTKSYPAASPQGTAILQVFVTKSALFILFILFNETKLLIPIGLITSIYALIYSITENSLRKLLAYNTIGQMGLMITAIGFGADIIPYLIGSMVYQTGLYLGASSIIYTTGKERLQETTNSIKMVPLIGVSSIISLFTMAALPLTVSFNAKNLMTQSISSTPILILFLVLSFGLTISCGIRVIYFTFFSQPRVQSSSLNFSSTIALIIISVLCLTPAVKVSSVYSVIVITKQVLLFIFSVIVFYLLRSRWYNISVQLIDVDCVYFVVKNCIYTIQVKVINYLCELFKRFTNVLINVSLHIIETKVEAVSYTLLYAMILIGIMVCII